MKTKNLKINFSKYLYFIFNKIYILILFQESEML